MMTHLALNVDYQVEETSIGPGARVEEAMALTETDDHTFTE